MKQYIDPNILIIDDRNKQFDRDKKETPFFTRQTQVYFNKRFIKLDWTISHSNSISESHDTSSHLSGLSE